ncbi:hypothetical protein V865_006226 [Kwoniella europaea PYCC6329]|uniref:Uncharacterized protein n=1 Tax=Kwoniella europaea PYCC6329 TaxID=1423913 RepID=A0AAX4KRB7_9TREE
MPAYPTYTHQRGSFSSSVIPDEDLAATISPEDVPDYLQHSIGMPPLEHVTDNMVEIPPETEWTTMYYNISKKDGTFSYRVIGNGNCDNNRGSNQDISYRCAKRFGQLVNEQINTFRSFHGTPSVHATCISRADTRGIFEHNKSEARTRD